MENKKIEIINILFIDIDWVLVPINKLYGWVWNKLDVPIHIYNFMNEMNEKKVKFIIHSSWREFLLDLEEFWEYNNLPKYIWNTSLKISKKEWILSFIDNLIFEYWNKNTNKVFNFVVLDDQNLRINKKFNEINENYINFNCIFIRPKSRKWLIWKEMNIIKDFFWIN